MNDISVCCLLCLFVCSGGGIAIGMRDWEAQCVYMREFRGGFLFLFFLSFFAVTITSRLAKGVVGSMMMVLKYMCWPVPCVNECVRMCEDV